MLIISGSDQEKFDFLSLVTRKTVGAMRIVAKFRAERWYREVEGSFLWPFRDHFCFRIFPARLGPNLSKRLLPIWKISERYRKNMGTICQKWAHNEPFELSAGHQEHRERVCSLDFIQFEPLKTLPGLKYAKNLSKILRDSLTTNY